MTKAIGKITTKKNLYCSICGCTHKRTVSVKIFSNTDEEIERAKQEATKRIRKEYTCRICKTIIKDVENAK